MALMTTGNDRLATHWCGCHEVVKIGEWEVGTDTSECIFNQLPHPTVDLMPAGLTPLGELLHTLGQVDHNWRTTRNEADRLALSAAWSVPTATSLRVGWMMEGTLSVLNTGQELWETFRTQACTPSVLYRYQGQRHDWLGICTGCGWGGTAQTGESEAIEQAHDHTHPEWRTIPVIASPRHLGDGTKTDTKWVDLAHATYGTDWLNNQGPVRTRRKNQMATRHVAGRAPGGGYDLAGGIEDQTTQDTLF